MIHALAPDTTDHQVFIGLDDFFFVETRSTKMAKYFTDFFLAYRTNLLLVGCPQQGKSSLISTSLRQKIEENKLVVFNFCLQRSTTLEAVQAHVERNLLKQGGNIVAPPAGKRVLIWLDDLNLNTSSTKPESLVRNIET